MRHRGELTRGKSIVIQDDIVLFIQSLLGWGRTTYPNGSLSDELMKVQVQVISDEKCREYYNVPIIADSMICAGQEKGGKGR